MVYFISRWEQAWTTRDPRKACEGIQFLSFDDLLGKSRFTKATYIFTDIDRMSNFELEAFAVIYRELKSGGAVVLNDPATVLTRYDLLKALHREQINDFNVYQPQYSDWPENYPVFLRRNAFHEGVSTDLLHSREELETGLSEILEQGIPHANTIAVEYAAEPSEGDIFRKFSVYRMGDRYFQDTTVNQKGWVVKSGESGIASEEFYQQENELIDTVPHKNVVKRVFEIANIQYGRVDFGMYQGRPQFYEVNTNPTVGFSTEHSSRARQNSRQAFVENYISAIESLQSSFDTGLIISQSKILRRVRKRNRLRKRWFRSFRSRITY